MPKTSHPTVDERRVAFGAWWDRYTDWPLAVAAILFLVAFSWLTLDAGLSTPVKHALAIVDVVTWVLFIVDYVVRLVTARRPWSFFWRNLGQLAIVALPTLRPLRFLAFLRTLNRRATKTFHGQVGLYTAVATILVVYSGALAVLQAERGHAGANITSFGISLWWTMTTITTVGYGDYTPVTVEGRIIAVVLMFAGIALIGIVTASVASYFVGRVSDPAPADPDTDTDTAKELRELKAQVAQLTTMLSGTAADRPAGSTG